MGAEGVLVRRGGKGKVKESTPQRLPRAAHAEPPAHAPNAALLIDFDNVTLGIRSDLQNQLRRLLNSDIIKGKVSVQRAYADWRRYPQYIVPLSEASIDLIFAPAFGSNKKNATDIRLAIDALELVFTRPEIGTFILLSGDSDFSSLVLKLKEYGKYVIGVGLRESSSDLLVQNCDEYYSYSELTGLSRETEAVHPRRDPWELVVEAVTTMKTRGDVMRSDRLKQVMQELDPSFDEKELGFSRFSKFLVEAGQRGLLKLTKMENGQYQVDLGPDANVPPTIEQELKERESKPPVEERRTRARDRVSTRLTLAQAFSLLKEVLLELKAFGEEATDAEQARERMMERAAAKDDPIFERSRFQRLLRQAHDANLIELVKSGEAYLLRLTEPPQEEEPQEGEKVQTTQSQREKDAALEGEPSLQSQRKVARGARPKTGRSHRARLRKQAKEASSGADQETQAPAPEPQRVPPESRTVPPEPQAEAGSQPVVAAVPPRRPVRSLRIRPGSRGYRPTVARPLADSGSAPQPPVPADARAARPDAGSAEDSRSGGAEVRGRSGPDTGSASADRAAVREESGGLLKRVTAALHKAVLGRSEGSSGDRA